MNLALTSGYAIFRRFPQITGKPDLFAAGAERTRLVIRHVEKRLSSLDVLNEVTGEPRNRCFSRLYRVLLNFILAAYFFSKLIVYHLPAFIRSYSRFLSLSLSVDKITRWDNRIKKAS